MATAAAGNEVAAKGGGKKKLIIIIAIVLVLVLAGVGALLMMKKKAANADEEGGAAEETHAPAAHAKPGTPPTFVPLDPFTVNLADKEVDRFAQVGVTLEVADPKFADQLKAYMPAIRNNVLLVLSHKTSAELLTVEGKEKLAREIRREAVRPMGIELDDEEEEDSDAPKKKKRKKKQVESPVTQVLFSTFIVQ
ncbi:flagellar basal body-associated FliL family protein [Roseateles depolymerans]|uniref:Flagellar protein FliL n=1 Tax=Roseateles depolymerans TaxID=76731 RepID=A0A0U3L4H0_9BURK|nr:flagellar basal body-associated FliL family protein [Roseateles depolymerans]ALV06206.1 Flagellar basal body-associated protein FliL [Roseateles depolymerans]REG19175.1 flagellar FliL protein [Roseateles depolymerans]